MSNTEERLNQIAASIWEGRESHHPLVQRASPESWHAYLEEYGVMGSDELGWQVVYALDGLPAGDTYDSLEGALEAALDLERADS